MTWFHKTQKLMSIVFIVLILAICVVPVLYFGVYRISDYFICRSIISQKLGMVFSPFTIEDYLKRSLTIGMTRDEVLVKLEEIGRVEIIPLKGGVDYLSTDQANLRICTHPQNTIIIFINYSSSGELISIKILGD